VPIRHPDALWRQAEARWAEIAANSPELAPAVALQQRLVMLILDAAASLDQRQALRLAPDVILDKWRRRLPALRGEVVTMPEVLRQVLPSICLALGEGGAGDSAFHIREALITSVLDADSLLRVSLARNRKAIRISSLHMGFSPDLIWLVGELGSCSLAYHLQQSHMSEHGRLLEWAEGYCPFCGSWPAFIELAEGTRTLRCSFCALGWQLDAHRCLYCANGDAGFVRASPEGRTRSYLELCARCGYYTKVIEVGTPTPFPLIAIEDLATMPLDEAAMDKAYQRPDLPDLDAIEPLRSC
jgi:hypothetical protein